MRDARHRRTGASKSGDMHRYKRSPFLISHWAGPILVFENYLKGRRLAGEGLISDVLSFCGKSRTLAEICAQFPNTNRRELREAIARMEKYALLEHPGGREATPNALRGWESWSPAASYFHFSTKDVKYARRDVDDFSGLQKIARENPLPGRNAKLRGAKRLPLRKPARGGEFARALRDRRTWREFSNKPMTRSQLEALLWLSFGVQGWARIPRVGRLALKTSPSGGALHPLEAYVVIRKVEGIAAGGYHYNSEKHGLEIVRKGIGGRQLKQWLAGQGCFCNAAMLVFLTAVFPRTQWKYGHSRAYRVVLAEAGHVCQTFCLTATWLGLAPFCTMAFADSAIEKSLRVDGIGESVIYAMGAGVRPKRTATADRLREK